MKNLNKNLFGCKIYAAVYKNRSNGYYVNSRILKEEKITTTKKKLNMNEDFIEGMKKLNVINQRCEACRQGRTCIKLHEKMREKETFCIQI